MVSSSSHSLRSYFSSKPSRHLIKSQTELKLFHSSTQNLCYPLYCNYGFQPQHNSTSLLNSVITSLSLCTSIHICQLIHSKVIKGLNYNDCFIGDRLVSIYARLGYFKDAHNLFDEIPNRDLVSWNTIISAFSRKGEVGLSLNAFYRMRYDDEMKPNDITLISLISSCGYVEGGYIHGFVLKNGWLCEIKVLNSLINMYGKFGYFKASSVLFEMIKLPNLVSWNSIIKIHIQNGLLETSMLYFNLMRRALIYPDQATIVTILQGCADMGVGNVVDAFHGYILLSGLDESIPIVTALLNLYAKSGRLMSACDVFDDMNEPDIIAWTVMLSAYAMHGYGKQAIEHFNHMIRKGHQPDHVTFTHLLSACSHSGLVNEGKKYFKIMSSVYCIEPRLDHYSCMVDLFGRSGHLRDAHILIDSMPMEPNAGVWGALLNGCKVYGDVKLGEEAANKLITLNPLDSRNYIMLSSIYSKAGRWVDFSKVRSLMKDKGVVRTAGCSCIEHDHKVHRFVVGDQAHPDSERVYAKLDEVMNKIGKAGYVANTEFVLHDVEEEVKGDLVRKHSEKLAIAFGLLVYNDKVPIIITKNLRICGDCHNMAKFVSLVEKRVIIIRDTRRFHHFADGLCSCGDYW
ncbi:pentatricopeptide repeat-containing protein At5g40410, mitochondrial [Rutidosis leptorrhynchoides]|uniref:pentatricopeptide repeat-containing protein At5g40410, mitochondrial n=1 Tax=Rutidosis leptorrhynchoides TaxID=125765 RepID=UPI003A991ECE